MVTLPVDVWRCLGEQAVDVLTNLLKKIFYGAKKLKMCERVCDLG